MIIFKILGSGCANCKRLEREVIETLATTELEYEVVKVTEYADIMAYGILSTPGLVINEQLVSAGRIPKRQQILAWAQQYNAH